MLVRGKGFARTYEDDGMVKPEEDEADDGEVKGYGPVADGWIAISGKVEEHRGE